MAKISIAKMKKKFFGNFIFFMQKEGRLGQNWSDSPRTTLFFLLHRNLVEIDCFTVTLISFQNSKFFVT